MASRHEEGDYDYEDDVPLHRKRAFGTGIKRKRVEFVKAQDADESAVGASQKEARKGPDIGELYASVVLGSSDPSTPPSSSSTKAGTPTLTGDDAEAPLCPVCSLPITGTVEQHNASLAHQVSLEHSHPPSALDRSRMGLRALRAHGWDPDARIGLGREGEGLRHPVKVAKKDDTLGVGAVIPETVKKEAREEKPKKLSAKEMRKLAEKEKKRAEAMHREIYGRVDVERYLRGDGGDGDA